LEVHFTIRGGEKLYNVKKEHFIFGTDQKGPYVQYNETLSKNYKVTLKWNQQEHLRPLVTIHDPNVVMILTTMMEQLPKACEFLFMQATDNPRTKMWFKERERTGERTLGKRLKTIYKLCALEHEGITIKSGRTMAVSWMAMTGVPAAFGAKITRHKSLGAYERYNKTIEVQVAAAQECIKNGLKYQ
jgi:hypothetical protein